jgi:hypothetical protein
MERNDGVNSPGMGCLSQDDSIAGLLCGENSDLYQPMTAQGHYRRLDGARRMSASSSDRRHDGASQDGSARQYQN